MPLITTKRFLVFHEPDGTQTCSVPPSDPKGAKEVPEWVLKTPLFALALKEASVTVIEVKNVAAKVEAEAKQAATTLEAEAKKALKTATAKVENDDKHK